MTDYLQKDKIASLRAKANEQISSVKNSMKDDKRACAEEVCKLKLELTSKIKQMYANSLEEANKDKAELEEQIKAIEDKHLDGFDPKAANDAELKAKYKEVKEATKEKVASLNYVRKNLTLLKQRMLKVQIEENEALIKRNNAFIKLNKIAMKEDASKKEELEAINTELEKENKPLKEAVDKDDEQLTLLMNKLARKGHNFIKWCKTVPNGFKKLGIKIWEGLQKLFWGIVYWFRDLGLTFYHGDWKTKVSYFIMGFGSVMRGQWLRGILFFLFEVVFILYLALFGGQYLGRLYILGTEETVEVDGVITPGENSFNILLYGVLTLFFIAAFIYTWYINIKQNRIAEEIIKDEKKLASSKDDLRALVDKDFHKTLLALPTLGILIFTVLPIFFMILVAFTSYDAAHQPPDKLFGWVGFDNFATLFSWGNSEGASFSMTFGQILLWTLVWAFFATFTNYFLGMLVAMLINKKGIKLKKLWRTILVFSIAVPQFISILFVSKMFAYDGIINGIFGTHIHFLDQDAPAWLARVSVIGINIWIGVPYLMLIVTGILMNIPADLYESANIDGASAWQQYSKITLPYMLFVTGPYLLTSFTGNMNNFNVIYLLTGGAPNVQEYYGNAGKTDLLITWLFRLTTSDSDYKLAAVIGIMVFVVVAFLSLVVYNLIPSTKNEEEFQ